VIEIDHLGITARDARASARALAGILGAGEPVADGADDDMYRVDLDHGASILFSSVETVLAAHVAFRVDASRFAAIVERLRERGVPFGNDPEDPRNGATTDPLGGAGRVYFQSEDGHLFEVVVAPASR